MMTNIAWANQMLKLAASEVHPDWLLECYKNQMRVVIAHGGNQYDDDCREIYRQFAMMVLLNQYHEGFISGFEWNPHLEAEDYLDFKAAIAKQKKKVTDR